MYNKLAVMAFFSFISMYVLMYLMVNSFVNVYPNLNQLYMAALMTAPMIALELWLMKDMYHHSRTNKVIIGITGLVFLLSLVCVRKQVLITDKEFLKSMIPHHAAALLMCEQASLQDPDVKKLCETIRKTQQEEIDFMKTKLAQS